MTPDETLREAVRHTIAAETATVSIRFAKAGEPSLDATGYVDFARRRSHLRYEIPGNAADEEPAESEQVLADGAIYVRAGAPGAEWTLGPPVSGAGPGDPFGFLRVLATARPGVRAFEASLVGGVSARRYQMVGDGERIWADGSPDVAVPLRERLGLTEPEDPVIDVWIDEELCIRRIEAYEESPLSPGAPLATTVEFADFGIEVGDIPIPTAAERLELADLLPERDESSGSV